MTHCIRVVQKSRSSEISFVPLFDFVYKDGTSPMVTIGGIITDQATREAVSCLLTAGTFTSLSSQPVELDLPILTPRERLILDRLLPSQEVLNPETIKDALGFSMRPSLTESYRRLYKFYPTFTETHCVS